MTALPTPGTYAVADIETTAAVPGPPPHRHVDADELMRDGAWPAVEAGGRFAVPKGTLHTFRAVGDTPARVISIHDPARPWTRSSSTTGFRSRAQTASSGRCRRQPSPGLPPPPRRTT
jgi:hypothetical protein